MSLAKTPSLYKRISKEIENYTSNKVELSEGVQFSQYQTIKRIFKFKNRDLSGQKINPDLSYEYYFDIISPRIDSEVKNLRFDSKHVLVFSRNPQKDFPAVFISNASMKSWMAENGEDDKLKAAVEEFSGMGNIIFKRIKGGYEITDPLRTIVTNQIAETIKDTDLIERHELTASQIKKMKHWQNKQDVIEKLGNKTFSATSETTPIDSTNNRYEVYEFTGEVSEKEFNEVNEIEEEGDEDTYFLAKVIVAGLKKGGAGETINLYCEKLIGEMDDHYIDAHRGRYEGRFWRVGMYELLFDHQIRANEIANQLARGLEWASKVVFKSNENSTVLQNVRADLENGDIIQSGDLQQLEVRMQGMDQLIAEWNRLMQDADRLANSLEVVRGESMPSGTPFRMGILLDQNAGKLFALHRQKITLPYKRVFREWVLPELVKDLTGEDIFNLTGDTDVLDQLRQVIVNSWYMQNLVQIGPHTKEVAETIKAEKLDELRNVDPTIKNSKEIWTGVLPRLFVTITGENSDLADNVMEMTQLMTLETDQTRLAFLLDSIYKIRGIPVPPTREVAPPETQLNNRNVPVEANANEKAAAEQPVEG